MRKFSPSLIALSLILVLPASHATAQASSPTALAPLVVDQSSHIIMMEYEN